MVSAELLQLCQCRVTIIASFQRKKKWQCFVDWHLLWQTIEIDSAVTLKIADRQPARVPKNTGYFRLVHWNQLKLVLRMSFKVLKLASSSFKVSHFNILRVTRVNVSMEAVNVMQCSPVTSQLLYPRIFLWKITIYFSKMYLDK